MSWGDGGRTRYSDLQWTTDGRVLTTVRGNTPGVWTTFDQDPEDAMRSWCHLLWGTDLCPCMGCSYVRAQLKSAKQKTVMLAKALSSRSPTQRHKS